MIELDCEYLSIDVNFIKSFVKLLYLVLIVVNL